MYDTSDFATIHDEGSILTASQAFPINFHSLFFTLLGGILKSDQPSEARTLASSDADIGTDAFMSRMNNVGTTDQGPENPGAPATTSAEFPPRLPFPVDDGLGLDSEFTEVEL